jgi:hypothetical protein
MVTTKKREARSPESCRGTGSRCALARPSRGDGLSQEISRQNGYPSQNVESAYQETVLVPLPAVNSGFCRACR